MQKKQEKKQSDYITRCKATLLLGFKNSRSVTELIKNGYLRTYTIDSSKRELLNKAEVLDLPQKDLLVPSSG